MAFDFYRAKILHTPRYIKERFLPLMVAAAWGDGEGVASLLCNDQVRVNAEDRFGCTALWWAMWNRQYHIVPLLLTGGADPNIGGTLLAITPLHIAAVRRDLPEIRLLWEYGANIAQCNEYGFDALDYAESGPSHPTAEEKTLKEEAMALLQELGRATTNPPLHRLTLAEGGKLVWRGMNIEVEERSVEFNGTKEGTTQHSLKGGVMQRVSLHNASLLHRGCQGLLITILKYGVVSFRTALDDWELSFSSHS